MILGCSSLGGGGTNLVVNPDFEAGSPGEQAFGWMTYQKLDGSVFRVVHDPTIAHSGSQCVSIAQTGSGQLNYAVWLQEMPAKAGTAYRYSFWIRTEDVRPLTPYNENRPWCCGTVGFLDANRNNLPPYPQSANGFMTHDWQRFEISSTTPEGTAFVKINLVLGNAVGTVYFDSASLAVSSFQKAQSAGWLSDAIVYELGPWEFSRFGSGSAFSGITRKLPELGALGVNLLYLMPVWESAGWYNITDHFTLFRKYGTERELRALVDEAHRLGMRVILDLAGTGGVPMESRLMKEHPSTSSISPTATSNAWMSTGIAATRPC